MSGNKKTTLRFRQDPRAIIAIVISTIVFIAIFTVAGCEPAPISNYSDAIRTAVAMTQTATHLDGTKMLTPSPDLILTAINPSKTPDVPPPPGPNDGGPNYPPPAFFIITPLPTADIARGVMWEVDRQLQEELESNAAFNVPESMNLEGTVTIEFLINPSLSQQVLKEQVIAKSGYPTSTADPTVLVSNAGDKFRIIAKKIEITEQMMVTLFSEDDAFVIKNIHPNPVQSLSNSETTRWEWDVTAKELGEKTLKLVVYRLIKVKDSSVEEWHIVETHRENIKVRVTALQYLSSLNWETILVILVTALLIPLFFRWYDARKKT